MADRRYRTAAWQRLRRRILERDGYWCGIQGPRCQGVANSVHHIIPSSQAPERFWDPMNLQAACSSCNYGGGARIAADNRRATGERIAELENRNWHLQQAVEELERRCEKLSLALAAATNDPPGEPARDRARPAVH